MSSQLINCCDTWSVSKVKIALLATKCLIFRLYLKFQDFRPTFLIHIRTIIYSPYYPIDNY